MTILNNYNRTSHKQLFLAKTSNHFKNKILSVRRFKVTRVDKLSTMEYAYFGGTILQYPHITYIAQVWLNLSAIWSISEYIDINRSRDLVGIRLLLLLSEIDSAVLDALLASKPFISIHILININLIIFAKFLG